MAGKGRDKNVKVKLKQPDRSGPDPTHQTLFELAEERGLLKDQEASDDGEVGRLGESLLWSLSLTMLHFTLDVLVTHQYAQDVKWPKICMRTAQTFPGMFIRLPIIRCVANLI